MSGRNMPSSVAACSTDEPPILPFPSGEVKCRSRLGGLLKHSHRGVSRFRPPQLSDNPPSPPAVNDADVRRESDAPQRSTFLGTAHPILGHPREAAPSINPWRTSRIPWTGVIAHEGPLPPLAPRQLNQSRHGIER